MTSDIVQRLRDCAEGGAAEPFVLETCSLAADDIERLWGALLGIDAVVMPREEQMIAEIRRRGEEITALRAALTLIVEDEEAFPIPPKARSVLLEALGRGVSR